MIFHLRNGEFISQRDIISESRSWEQMDKKQGRFLNFKKIFVVLCSCIDFAFVLRAYIIWNRRILSVHDCYRPKV